MFHKEPNWSRGNDQRGSILLSQLLKCVDDVTIAVSRPNSGAIVPNNMQAVIDDLRNQVIFYDHMTLNISKCTFVQITLIQPPPAPPPRRC